MNTKYLTGITVISIMLASCLIHASLFADISTSPKPKPERDKPNYWKLLIVRPQFKFTIIDPISKTHINTQMRSNTSANKNSAIFKQRASVPSCISANYPTHTVLCQSASGSTLFDFNTGTRTKTRLKSYGPISANGRYIIDQQGRNILDLKTMKYIQAYDPLWSPNNEPRLHTKAGVGIEILSNIRGNGELLVKTIDENGNQLNAHILYKVNIQNIIAGKGKNFRLHKLNIKQLGISNETFRDRNKYRLQNGKLLIPLFNTAKQKSWSIKSISDQKFNLLQSSNLFAGLCNVTTDDSWVVCWIKTSKKSTIAKTIIYNIKSKKMSIHKLPVGQVFWLWTGKQKNIPDAKK